jgi:hypothetical protein
MIRTDRAGSRCVCIYIYIYTSLEHPFICILGFFLAEIIFIS